MVVRVKLFGQEATAADRREVDVRVPDGATCEDIRDALADVLPVLSGHLPACRFAVNHEFAPSDRVVKPTDEVALIGLVSGG